MKRKLNLYPEVLLCPHSPASSYRHSSQGRRGVESPPEKYGINLPGEMPITMGLGEGKKNYSTLSDPPLPAFLPFSQPRGWRNQTLLQFFRKGDKCRIREKDIF